MARKFLIPRSPILDANGQLRPEWQNYLSGIQELSQRLNDVASLDVAATLPEAVAKINEILTLSRTTD